MNNLRTGALLTTLAVLAGCSGGGGGSSSPVAPRTTAAKATAAIKLTIPSARPQSATRRAKYVSPSTNGVLVQVYAHSDSAHANVLAATAADVSNGSSACVASGGGRTCTISIPAPVGVDDFAFTEYDQAPQNGAFAGNANALGTGSVANVTIVALQANSILVTLGGIVASFGTTTRFSAPADAVSQTSIAFTPTDAAGNAIITDPYATPISVTLTEVLPYPFDPHVALLVNGQNVGMTATLNSPADTLAVAYDGGGGPPYWATIALTSGSASQTLTFNPYYLTSSDAYFEVGPNPIFHFTASGQFATATYAENGYAFTDAFTNAAECAGIATVSPFANNALAITTTATSGNCTVYVFDGNVTRMLSISIVAPAPSPSPSPSPSPVPSATP